MGLSVVEARRRFTAPFAAPRSNLPLRGTSFIGRSVERAEVLRALTRPEVRLLTLVGPVGIGKTRLALEVAREAQARQEVAFVSLEAEASLATLPITVANTLDVTLPADRPPFDALLSALEARSLLLVLDSAEHLLAGAPFLTTLLQTCPGLTLLVTSRERLGLEEEWALTLGGMTVPAVGMPKAPQRATACGRCSSRPGRGFTRAAAGEVASATLATLASLSDKSLIRTAGPGRFDLHVLLLQFAHERLTRRPQEEARALQAHGAYFLNMCEQAYEAIRQLNDEKRWCTRIDQDLDNVRAALTRSIRRGELNTALKGVTWLRDYWIRAGRSREARRWFAQVFAHGAAIDPILRERALAVDGQLAMNMHDHPSARRQLETSLALSRVRKRPVH